MKKAKNATANARTWEGQEIASGAYYELSVSEYSRWANSSDVIASVCLGDLVMNDGAKDITLVVDAVSFLRDDMPKEVITQFEKDDKTLKICSGVASVGGDSKATIMIRVPGTPGTGQGRFISAGEAWFSAQHEDDLVEAWIIDVDNILGYGAGFQVGSYTDDEAAEGQKGWRIPAIRGTVRVEAIGGYGFILSGLYIKIAGTKGGGITTGKLFTNLEWGKAD